MTAGRRAPALAAVAATASLLVLPWTGGEAHTPITSPFTFNEDVYPIVEERCGACHAPGGVAPMSLLTHADAVPWGESIRAELMAGHMPPWGLDSAPGRFRNVQGLTARELNVLLTWASGGTPAGDPARAPAAPLRDPVWPLGPPDVVLPLPDVTLTEEETGRLVEFTIDVPAGGPRWLRAVDLQPGTPAIVRSASVSIAQRGGDDQRLALWLPGDHPVALEAGTAFQVPEHAVLTVRVNYRKTWEYERKTMSDRSALGLYAAPEAAGVVRGLPLTAAGRIIDNPVQAVAIAPDEWLGDVDVTVTAIRPDGSRATLIAFSPRRGWARRYWFREPILLPRGTRLVVDAALADDRLLPPAALRPSGRINPQPVRLTLDVVAGR